MRDHDYSAASDFLAAFFGPTTTHQVEIRALPNQQGDPRNPPKVIYTREAQVIEIHCRKFDQLERAVYFAVATRKSGVADGHRTNCIELPALWVDIDCYKIEVTKEEAVGALLSLPIPPGIIIDSGGGIHAYWMLNEAIQIGIDEPNWMETDFEVISVLKQLRGILAGDPLVCQCAAIMRLPGSHNTKLGDLRPCIVLECSTWGRCEFSDIVEMLDTQRPLLIEPAKEKAEIADDNPFLVAARAFTYRPPTDINARLAAMSYLGSGDSGIHATQLSVSASLVSGGAQDDEIVTLLLDATYRAAGTHALNWNWRREEATIRRMIASARAKFIAPLRTAPRSATVIELRTTAGPKAAPLADEPEPDITPPCGSFVQNDIGNAFALIDQHGRDLRYVLGIGWHVWDGKRYAPDTESVIAQKMAHDVSAKMLTSAADMPASKARTARVKWAIASGNKSRITGMLDQAKSYIHAQADALDADPMLLNCANGTVDLQSLELRPHAQADLLTKVCPVEFDPRAPCPIWERFLFEIFDGDVDLIAFIQRALGYSLTGRTDEQVVFIMHGAGSNGKSVLLETIASVLTDYVKRSPAETWISKPYNGPSNDIAALAGARFVSVIETEHDKALAEALVKQATGGDAMTVRFLHREFFSFVPKFKLWFATNHKPKIRGSDYAIWRRILLLPFLVTFVDADKLIDGQKIKDPDLKNKLAAEYPGILAWMIRGCAAWQELGLDPPDAVRLATESYQDAQDNVSGFIRDNCSISRGITCEVGLLYLSYEIWCEENEENALAKNSFGRNLDERGFPNGPRGEQVRTRKGIDLKRECRQAAEDRKKFNTQPS